MRTYTKEIPQTVTEFINTIRKECRVPLWMTDNFFLKSEIEDFIQAETSEERAECLEAWLDDIKVYIELYEHIKAKLENWKE